MVPLKGGHHLHYHPCMVEPLLNSPSNGWSPPPLHTCTVEPLLNGPSKGWSPPLLTSMYSATSTTWSLKRVVTTSITIHMQWHVNWMVPPMGDHHLHFHPCTVEPLLNSPSNGWSPPPLHSCTLEPLLNGPSKGWSPPLLTSMYSGTSTIWSLQRVVTTSITIHMQWHVNWMVPPMGGHHLHFHPCAVVLLLYGPSICSKWNQLWQKDGMWGL